MKSALGSSMRVLAAIFVSIVSLLTVGGWASDTEGMNAKDILGAIAFARDGKEVGRVSNVKSGENGEIIEVYLQVPSALGLGERTIAVPGEIIVSLRGAVVVELTVDEIARLPAVGATR